MASSAAQRFHGGVHPPERKELSNAEPIRTMPVPKRVTLPLQQHIGRPAEPLVAVGDRVLAGQPIARPDGYVSASLHATTSGTVVAIEERPIAHPSGLPSTCIVIDADGADEWIETTPVGPGFTEMPPAQLRQRLRDAGVVGLGGAAFPTAVKLNPAPDKPIDTLLLNAAECEPYITCDDRTMRERAPALLEGLGVLSHILGHPQRVVIGIEDNKPEATDAVRAAIATTTLPEGMAPVEVATVGTVYPAGGEKQLIKAVTGREVPRNGLPMDIGVVCQNVATAIAARDVVLDGRPLVSRVLTVTGSGMSHPGNVEVRIGTSFGDVIAFAGGYAPGVARLVMGGPMMGFAVHDDVVPVVKGTNCILGLSSQELPEAHTAMPCIRCGDCVDVCPANLLPQQLYWFAKAKDFDKAQDYHLFDCIECGCCSYVCPSHIPLVQYYRFAKNEIWMAEKDRRKADLARQRFENRKERLVREKAEKEARQRKRRQSVTKDAEGKQGAVDAALERAKAKQSAKRGPAAPSHENGEPAMPEHGEAVSSSGAGGGERDGT